MSPSVGVVGSQGVREVVDVVVVVAVTDVREKLVDFVEALGRTGKFWGASTWSRRETVFWEDACSLCPLMSVS